MGNFWADRLGQATPPVPQQPAPAPPSNRPWWQPAPVQPQAPAAPQPVYQQVQQQTPQTQDGKVPIGVLLQQTEYTTDRAQSAKDSERCPDCGSGNYLHIAGQEKRAKRCFDCGSNPMFSHSTQGISTVGQNLPQKVARVQNAPVRGAAPMGSLINPGQPLG